MNKLTLPISGNFWAPILLMRFLIFLSSFPFFLCLATFFLLYEPLPPIWVDFPNRFFNFSLAYSSLDSLPKAIELMTRAYQIFLQFPGFGANHPHTKLAFKNLSKLQEKVAFQKWLWQVNQSQFKFIHWPKYFFTDTKAPRKC